MNEVLVVGAGPVGLTMAAELQRHGVKARIIDRLSKPSPYCRAIGVTPRTLEVFDDMGLARDMIDAGLWIEGYRSIIHGHPSSDSRLDLSDLPYSELGLPQYETERLLTRHLASFGVEVERGVELKELVQNAEGATAQLSHEAGEAEQATFPYVVGCDGAHSAVRHALGLKFEGDAFPMMFMLGDVRIDWDLPRGMALRALRLIENDAPDMFIAIPLPEPGRYRVSTKAASELVTDGGTSHGIQSEMPGPSLRQLQAVADDLLPDKPKLSDMRWSSVFRISMRLAEHYRVGRCFIAGDAAHIHPPTGGQGMNTGIQDAYNLAWKLALVLKSEARESLLDSYEAERRPVGEDVIARTVAASVGYGREKGGRPDRLADTQILVSYRGTNWVSDDGPADERLPKAGDRAPDANGLRRHNVGFAMRAFDFLRGPEHVLLAHLDGPERLDDLSTFAVEPLAKSLPMRIVAVTRQPDGTSRYGIAVYHDSDGQFATVYGEPGRIYLIRSDGYIGWRGTDWREASLKEYAEGIGSARKCHGQA